MYQINSCHFLKNYLIIWDYNIITEFPLSIFSRWTFPCTLQPLLSLEFRAFFPAFFFFYFVCILTTWPQHALSIELCYWPLNVCVFRADHGILYGQWVCSYLGKIISTALGIPYFSVVLCVGWRPHGVILGQVRCRQGCWWEFIGTLTYIEMT